MKRIVVALVVIAALGATGYFVYQRQAAQAAVKPSTGPGQVVKRGNILASVTSTGSTDFDTVVRLSFKSGGRLAETKVAQGSTVKPGDVIARQDTADLEQQVVQAEANLASAQSSLANIQAGPRPEDVASARAALDSARAQLAKAKIGPTEADLVASKVALDKAEAALRKAQSDYDQVSWRGDRSALPQATALETATLDYQSAEAALRQKQKGPTPEDIAVAQASVTQAENALKLKQSPYTQKDVDAARAQVTQAQTALATAKSNLESTTLVSPIEGRVSTIDFQPGERVNAGQVIATVVSAAMHADAKVDEIDIGKIKEGLNATITFDSLTDVTLKGKIKSIAPAATVQSGVVSFPLVISLDSVDARVRGGMTANVNIIVAERNNVVLVPNRALTTKNRVRSVQVEKPDGTVETRTVKTGLNDDQSTEILEGLTEGDKIVLPSTTLQLNIQSGGQPGGGMPAGGAAAFGKR